MRRNHRILFISPEIRYNVTQDILKKWKIRCEKGVPFICCVNGNRDDIRLDNLRPIRLIDALESIEDRKETKEIDWDGNLTEIEIAMVLQCHWRAELKLNGRYVKAKIY